MQGVSVILPAAGSGKRFGAGSNKIFQPLCGRAIFLRSIDLFAARDDVSQILLATSPADAPELSERFGTPDRRSFPLHMTGKTGAIEA